MRNNSDKSWDLGGETLQRTRCVLRKSSTANARSAISVNMQANSSSNARKTAGSLELPGMPLCRCCARALRTSAASANRFAPVLQALAVGISIPGAFYWHNDVRLSGGPYATDGVHDPAVGPSAPSAG